MARVRTIREFPGNKSLDTAPPLEPGDHLSRDEFERRYRAMPELIKAELMEGVVFMPSPLRWMHHANPQKHLLAWMAIYEVNTPHVQAGGNASIRLDLDNEPQPDATMLIDPAHGGQARISSDDYIEGAPEMVAEVAASTVSIDLNTKLLVYRRNQVREYLVWRAQDAAVDWFALRQTQYDRLPVGADGYYKSEVFPGLWLDPAALVRFDLATVLQVLQKGLATPEHAEFVTRLEARRG